MSPQKITIYTALLICWIFGGMWVYKEAPSSDIIGMPGIMLGLAAWLLIPCGIYRILEGPLDRNIHLKD